MCAESSAERVPSGANSRIMDIGWIQTPGVCVCVCVFVRKKLSNIDR